jgi:hypothetical protein
VRRSVPGPCHLSLQTAGSVSNSYSSLCRVWSIVEYVIDCTRGYRCGGVADYVICSVCKTERRVRGTGVLVLSLGSPWFESLSGDEVFYL